jgi:hypothetical protein
MIMRSQSLSVCYIEPERTRRPSACTTTAVAAALRKIENADFVDALERIGRQTAAGLLVDHRGREIQYTVQPGKFGASLDLLGR